MKVSFVFVMQQQPVKLESF